MIIITVIPIMDTHIKNESKRIIIIDSFALIFRAYYAYPKSLSTEKYGVINAVYGFANFLIEILNKFNPEYIVVVADSEKPTIRSAEYVLYKANRKQRDEELISQIPLVFQIVEAFDIPIYKTDGYEADDIIGTICNQAREKGFKSTVVTGDQDLFQLIDDENINVFLTGRTFADSKIYHPKDVYEKLGITPVQVPDYKGLAGDASDNIPGVKGIGKKTAQDLIQQWKSVDEIYENIDQIKPTVQKKLVENYEMAIRSRNLATIDIKVPITFEIESAKATINKTTAINALLDFNFKSLEAKVRKLEGGVEVPLHNESQIKVDLDIPIKKYVKRKIECSEIFIIPPQTDKSVKNETTNVLFMTNESSDIEEIDPEDLKYFFENTNAQNIISDDIKLVLYLSDKTGFIKTAFEDFGYIVQLLSGGEFMHTRSSLVRYFGIVASNASQELLINIFERFHENKSKIDSDPELNSVYELEKELLLVVKKMEENGIILDKNKINEFTVILEDRKLELTRKLYKLAGKEFNLNSPRQVGEVLYSDQKIQPISKTKTGAFSTNESALLKLKGASEFVDLILQYRETEKILTTYLLPLPTFIKQDRKIHSSFDQMGAVSGRFSSKYPNMQNIPLEIPEINLREAFTASEENILFALDYSQQELRILAHISKEQTLISAFNDNLDIHALTASKLFDKKIKDVTKEERSTGKTINFSIVYGISSFGLSERMQIPRGMAQDLIKKFYETYPGIRNFYDNSKVDLYEKLFTKTMLGRARKSSNLKTMNFTQKSAVERELLNFMIQGTAADIVKKAMVEVDNIIGAECKLLLQVHDELVFEYYAENKFHNTIDALKDANFMETIKQIKTIMESVVELDVDLKVDSKVGYNWGNMTKIHI